MAKTPKKKTQKVRADFAQNAFRIVQEATGQAPKTPDPDEGKNPKAVALGRKGGLKGGTARAKKLTKKKLSEVAHKGAKARWNPDA